MPLLNYLLKKSHRKDKRGPLLPLSSRLFPISQRNKHTPLDFHEHTHTDSHVRA